MQRIKKKLLGCIALLTAVTISCQQSKKPKMNKKFEWTETISCPIGYPIDVYRGGLESADGGFTSLYMGTMTGKGGWGYPGGGMSSGVKTVPNHLHVIWLSYGEDKFYEIDTDIDYEKMVELFRKGFYTPSRDKSRPEPFKREYNQITVGFAPGGVVIVWLSGAGRQVEIGRYQGRQIQISKQESDHLERGPIKNMFDPEYRKRTMKNIGIVPLEVQKANEGKPIPYGLWDSYRKKYKWKVKFILPFEGKLDETNVFFYNGEQTMAFGEADIQQYPDIIKPELRWDNRDEKAIPKIFKFSWITKEGVLMVADIVFDEQEIFEVFKEIYKDTPDLETELVIRVSLGQDDLSVKLIPEGEDVDVHYGWISNSKIKIYDTSKYK